MNLDAQASRKRVESIALTVVLLELVGSNLCAAEAARQSEKAKEERSAVGPTTRGVTDASVLSVTTVSIPRLMDGPANEFTESLQAEIPATRAANSYEKAALYVRVRTADPSDYRAGHLKDAVGVESQSQIMPGNMTGRAWSFDSLTSVLPGADGYAVGMELGIVNDGSDQPLTGFPTSKNGLHLVGSGSFGGTAGVVLGGKWHDGVVCPSSALSDACFRVWDGSKTLAEVTKTGEGEFASITPIGAGTSSATFFNWCLDTKGKPYLGACLFGSSNSVRAQYALVGGFAASDNGEYGSAHWSAASFGHGAGDSQWGWRILVGTIPAGGGTVRLNTQGVGSPPSASNTLPVPLRSALQLDCKMLAHSFDPRTNTSASADWSLEDALFEVGETKETLRLVGGEWTARHASSAAAQALRVSISPDPALGSINISVQSATSGPWDITARCFSTEAR